jgi:hypothetical protein
MKSNGRIPLYFGDNGTQRFWESTNSDILIMQVGSLTAPWMCLQLPNIVSPYDKARQAKARPGEHYILSAKTLVGLQRRIKAQYGIAVDYDLSHRWEFGKGKGRVPMVLLAV